MGFAGFNFVIIDQNMDPFHFYEDLSKYDKVAAESVNITPIIRVAKNDESLILRALDIGVQGVEIPQINRKEDAVKAVNSVKFSPQGFRGVCKYVRAANYSSMDRFKYFESANKETMIIIHIEGIKGINNLDEILSVSGIDVIFIGSHDISQALGIPDKIDDPLVEEKMQEVILKCRK